MAKEIHKINNPGRIESILTECEQAVNNGEYASNDSQKPRQEIMKRHLVLLPYCVEAVDELQDIARKKGLAVEVIRHDEEILGILKKYDPKSILGVACPRKVEKVGAYLDSIGIDYQAIELDSNECLKVTGEKTKVNKSAYKMAVNRFGEK